MTDHQPTSTPRQGEALSQREGLGLTAKKKECWAGQNKVTYLVKTNLDLEPWFYCPLAVYDQTGPPLNLSAYVQSGDSTYFAEWLEEYK